MVSKTLFGLRYWTNNNDIVTGILGLLSQNVNAFNDPPIGSSFQPWNGQGWTTGSSWNSKVSYGAQRLPQSVGVTTAVWEPYPDPLVYGQTHFNQNITFIC